MLIVMVRGKKSKDRSQPLLPGHRDKSADERARSCYFTRGIGPEGHRNKTNGTRDYQ